MSDPQLTQPSAVPIFFANDPSGQARDVPFAQMHDALRNGGKPGVYMTFQGDSGGQKRVVPADQVREASQHGGSIVPIENQAKGIPEYYGFTPGNVTRNAWQGFKGTIAGVGSVAKDLAANPNWVFGENSTLQKFIADPMHQEAGRAVDAFDKGDYTEAFGHALASGLPGIGPMAAQIGEQAGTGDVGGAAGQVAGQLGAVKATQLAGKIPGAVKAAVESPAGKAGIAVTKAAAKELPVAAIKRIPYVGKVASDVYKAASKAAAEAKPPVIAPSEAEPFEGVSSPQAEQAAALPEEAAASETAAAPGAVVEPETPAIPNKKPTPAELKRALEQALGYEPVKLKPGTPIVNRGVRLGGRAPLDDAAGPGKITERPPEASPTSEDASPKTDSTLAYKSPTGTIKNASSVKPVDTARAAPLPEGFTPVDSSLLKGYKYDAPAKEFTAILKNGESYTHGEVTPEQVEAFEKADSQGSAWTKQIRQRSALVQKNGESYIPRTMHTETGEVIPMKEAGMEVDPALAAKAQSLADFIRQPAKKAAASPVAKPEPPPAEGDLLGQLQQMLDEAKAKKAGAANTAAGTDAYPVKIVYDEHGIPTAETDGRHRVIQAIENGQERIAVIVDRGHGPVQTTVDPKVLARQMGVTKESLAATDAQQSYRKGNLQPREPKIANKIPTEMRSGELSPSQVRADIAADKDTDFAGEPNYQHYGLRASSDPVVKGQELEHSFQWADGEPTDIRLPGTSAMHIASDTDVEHAVNMMTGKNLRPGLGGYHGKRVALIGSNDVMRGEDPGEGLFSHPRVIAVYENPPSAKALPKR